MNKKGVSPVIATLLLIVIAVAAAVVTYTFVMGFVGTTTTSTPPITTERIIVEAVEVDTSTQSVKNVYVRNVGSVTVNVTAIYLVRYDGVVVKSNTNVDETISPGELKQIPANIEYTAAKPNELYYVQAVTTGGAMASSSSFKLK
jgi:flagellin-like protein